MRTPLDAILLILSFEQLRLRRYLDAAGKATIGWGHLVRSGETLPDEITRERANALFLDDLADVEAGVLQAVGGAFLAEHEFGALVSFAFNTGVHALRTSTLLGKALANDGEGAALEFRRWVKGGPEGKKVEIPGLVVRRAAEERLWRGSSHA